MLPQVIFVYQHLGVGDAELGGDCVGPRIAVDRRQQRGAELRYKLAVVLAIMLAVMQPNIDPTLVEIRPRDDTADPLLILVVLTLVRVAFVRLLVTMNLVLILVTVELVEAYDPRDSHSAARTHHCVRALFSL